MSRKDKWKSQKTVPFVNMAGKKHGTYIFTLWSSFTRRRSVINPDKRQRNVVINIVCSYERTRRYPAYQLYKQFAIITRKGYGMNF